MMKKWLLAVLLLLFCAKPDPFEFVDVRKLDDTIQIDLKYASDDNFFGRKFYQSDRCALRRSTAERLVRVHKKLQAQGYGIKIWDAYRPLSVQWQFWQVLPDARYVADPNKGSRHNRGSAVDVTVVDHNGQELEMPTGFDDFRERAWSDYADLPDHIIKNRSILKEAMISEGFQPIETEWWHYDDPQWQLCEVMDIPVEALF